MLPLPVTTVQLTGCLPLLQSCKHSLQHKIIPFSKEKIYLSNSHGFYFAFFSIFEYNSECTLLHLKCSRVWTVCQQSSSVLIKSATVFSSPLLKIIELLILMEQSCLQHYCSIGCRRYVWNLHSCHAVCNASVKKSGVLSCIWNISQKGLLILTLMSEITPYTFITSAYVYVNCSDFIIWLQLPTSSQVFLSHILAFIELRN